MLPGTRAQERSVHVQVVRLRAVQGGNGIGLVSQRIERPDALLVSLGAGGVSSTLKARRRVDLLCISSSTASTAQCLIGLLIRQVFISTSITDGESSFNLYISL